MTYWETVTRKTMHRPIIYPYKMSSGSARFLARSLGAIRVFPDRNYRPRKRDVIVNWGSSTIPKWEDSNWYAFLNNPRAVAVACNKLKTFEKLQEHGVSTVPFTTTQREASQWDNVVIRHTLNGHGGEGVELGHGHDLPQAGLYTKLVESVGEYRVHVFNGLVIDYCKKLRTVDNMPVSAETFYIRSHDHGWIFTRNNLTQLDRIKRIAVYAIDALGLDFGGVDIIRDSNGDVFVLEVNTAVGMAKTTLEKYTDAVNRVLC